MASFFCLLFDPVTLANRFAFALVRNLLLTSFIILNACNSNPQGKQATDTQNIPVNFILTNPTPLTFAESERLRIACEAWYYSVLKGQAFNGGIVVAKNGNIIFEAYNGNGDPRGTDTITDSTSFHIASVSKTFTAMSVLRLWQEGKLNIDDEFVKYFPAFNYPGVTIRTLLNHRSGLPNYVHFMDNMGWDRRINVTNEDVLDFLINHKSEMKDVSIPDRRFTYCNTNYALLALLIEKLSGKKYREYLQETFFSPLNMRHTFVYDNTDSGKVTLSYDYRGRAIPSNFLDMVYGDKNIYSTPRDLLTWDRALTSGILFSQKTLVEAYLPYSNEKPGIRNYGLGWRMNIYPWGKKMIFHNGWWHGNNAAFIRLLEDTATIIVLGNKYDRGIYQAKELANLFGNYSGGEEEESEAAKSPGRAIKSTKRPARHHSQKKSAASKNKSSHKATTKKTTSAKKKKKSYK